MLFKPPLFCRPHTPLLLLLEKLPGNSATRTAKQQTAASAVTAEAIGRGGAAATGQGDGGG